MLSWHYYSISVAFVKTQLRKASHSAFNIQLHIVFVTKYRKPVINKAILERIDETFRRLCKKRQNILVEFSGEVDHVHLLVSMHPDNNISNFIASIKAASSRIVRQEFPEHIKKFYWGNKAMFWSNSYCAISCGGAPLDVLKKYINSQSQPTS